ncbi:MAG: hypothetical protein ACT4PZ_03620 [Panacagrimonas sp.]
MKIRYLMLCLCLAMSATWVQAQSTAPTPPLRAATPEPDEQPAVSVPEDLRGDSGTTIVGERESPIGLYITPWRNAYAEQDIDRPARLLRVDMSLVDRDVFARQVEYYDALTEAALAKQAPTAAAPASPTPDSVAPPAAP